MNKSIITVAFAVMAIVSIWLIATIISANYEYKQNISAEWNLADKSSTISAKREHLDKFVDHLAKANLQGSYNAVVFKTPDNSFDANFEALKSLQSRLHEIEGMNVKSFEYQTAIQQITSQEQGDAQAMLDVFEGCWYLRHHPLLWDWIGVVVGLFLFVGTISTGILTGAYWLD